MRCCAQALCCSNQPCCQAQTHRLGLNCRCRGRACRQLSVRRWAELVWQQGGCSACGRCRGRCRHSGHVLASTPMPASAAAPPLSSTNAQRGAASTGGSMSRRIFSSDRPKAPPAAPRPPRTLPPPVVWVSTLGCSLPPTTLSPSPPPAPPPPPLFPFYHHHQLRVDAGRRHCRLCLRCRPLLRHSGWGGACVCSSPGLLLLCEAALGCEPEFVGKAAGRSPQSATCKQLSMSQAPCSPSSCCRAAAPVHCAGGEGRPGVLAGHRSHDQGSPAGPCESGTKRMTPRPSSLPSLSGLSPGLLMPPSRRLPPADVGVPRGWLRRHVAAPVPATGQRAAPRRVCGDHGRRAAL